MIMLLHTFNISRRQENRLVGNGIFLILLLLKHKFLTEDGPDWFHLSLLYVYVTMTMVLASAH